MAQVVRSYPDRDATSDRMAGMDCRAQCMLVRRLFKTVGSPRESLSTVHVAAPLKQARVIPDDPLDLSIECDEFAKLDALSDPCLKTLPKAQIFSLCLAD